MTPGTRKKVATIWDMLVEIAQHSGGPITYTQIANKVGGLPRGVGRLLGPIQDFCLANSAPPLTSLVVRKNGKNPGDGYIPRGDLFASQENARNFNWAKFQNPFG